MGLFSWFRRKPKNYQHPGVTDEKAWSSLLWNLRGYVAENASGEVVNEQTAFKYSAVFNAVTQIASTTASLPLHLMRGQEKTTLPFPAHPLYGVLHDQANEYMSAMTFREVIHSHILTWGNGYAEKIYNGYGQVVALWPISPDRVSPKLYEGELIYEIQVDHDTIVLGRDKILHIPGLGFDGFVGYSVIQLAAQCIGLGMSMETFGAKYFGSGAHPGLILKHPGRLSEDAAKKLKKSVEAAHSGLKNSHRVMLLEEGLETQDWGMPPEDSQFIEGRSFQVTDVARWFNIPVHKLKELSKSSFNNIESEQISFVMDCIRLWCQRLEQCYNAQLLSPAERRRGLYFNHVLEGLLRGSAKDRGEFYSKMFSIGAFSINMILKKENMNPIDDPMGDEHFIPANMVPLSNAKNLGAQKVESTPAGLGGDQSDNPTTPTNLISVEGTPPRLLNMLRTEMENNNED